MIGGAEADPHALEDRHFEGRAIVDGGVVFCLVRGILACGRIDGIPAPHEVDVGAQAGGEQLREVVGGADQRRGLPGAVEAQFDHREVPGVAAPGILDVVARTRYRERRRERELPVEGLEARAADLGDPEPSIAGSEEGIAHGALIRDLGAEAEFPVFVQRQEVLALGVDGIEGVHAVLVAHVDLQAFQRGHADAEEAHAVIAVHGPRLRGHADELVGVARLDLPEKPARYWSQLTLPASVMPWKVLGVIRLSCGLMYPWSTCWR